MEQAGLTVVESLGVIGIGKPEEFIIQVMTKLVKERAKKGLKCYDALLLGRAHPEGNDRERPAFRCLIEPMEFTPGSRRTNSHDTYADRRYDELVCYVSRKLPAEQRYLFSVTLFQSSAEAGAD